MRAVSTMWLTAVLGGCSTEPSSPYDMNWKTCNVTVQRTLSLEEPSSMGFDAETLASELRVRVDGAGHWTADSAGEVVIGLSVSFGEPLSAEEITYDSGNCMRVPYDELYVRVHAPYIVEGTLGGDALEVRGLAELWAQGPGIDQVAWMLVEEQTLDVSPALLDSLASVAKHEYPPPYTPLQLGLGGNELGMAGLGEGWLQVTNDPDVGAYSAFRWEGAHVAPL